MGRDVAADLRPINERFFECKDIGEVPEINKKGFWGKDVKEIKLTTKRRSG